MQDNGAHDPVGADAFIRPQKFDEILWRGQGLACRLGRCFCILPYAEVSTGDPHPRPTDYAIYIVLIEILRCRAE